MPAALQAACGKTPFVLSGVSREGVTPLLRAAFGEIRKSRTGGGAEGEDGADPLPWAP